MADEAIIYKAQMTLTTEGDLAVSIESVDSKDLRDSFKGEQSDWLDRMLKSHDIFGQILDEAVDKFNTVMEARN